MVGAMNGLSRAELFSERRISLSLSSQSPDSLLWQKEKVPTNHNLNCRPHSTNDGTAVLYAFASRA